MPSETDCPEWFEDIPTSREGEFQARLTTAFDRIETFLRHRCPLESDVRELHRILFEDFVPVDYYAGNFRQDNDDLKCLSVNVQVGAKPGAPFQDVDRSMSHLCSEGQYMMSSVHANGGGDAAKRFAVAVAYVVGEFIRVHPFLNGNGRVSRLLWYWLCRRMSVKPQVSVFPRPPSRLYATCMSESMSGNHMPLAIAILSTLASRGEVPRSP